MITVSTPSADHRPQVVGAALTVQTLTASPAACAAPTSSASHAGHEGVDGAGAAARPPRPAGPADRQRSAEQQPTTARRPSAAWTARRGWHGERRDDRLRSVQPGLDDRRRPSAPPPPRSGRSRARRGAFLISTLTIMPSQTAQDVGRAGDVGRQLADRQLADRADARRSSASWWTTSAPSAVRRTSSSTPSAPSRRASAKASIVFSTQPLGATPMGEDGRHRARRPCRPCHGSRRRSAVRDLRRKTPCLGTPAGPLPLSAVNPDLSPTDTLWVRSCETDHNAGVEAHSDGADVEPDGRLGRGRLAARRPPVATPSRTSSSPSARPARPSTRSRPPSGSAGPATRSEPCLDFALATNQESGVWGGTSEEERRKLRKAWLAARRSQRVAG